MSYYPIESKYIALGKEGTRGTAVIPSRYIAVARDSEFDYKLSLIEDDLVRGIFERYPPQAGIKDGTGRISKMDVTSLNCGEIFYSLLGTLTTAHPGTLAYKHTILKNNSSVQNQSFTFHIERSLVQKQYPLSVVKSVTITQSADGKTTMDADILFKSEDAEGFSLSPTWVDPKPFMFYQNTVTIDSTPNVTAIKDWSLTIDNQSVPLRVLSGSQNIVDVLTIGKLLVSGAMTVYFTTEADRTKFLANTSATLKFSLVGALIEATYYNQLDIDLKEIHYTAYPFGEVDGLLGASVTFNAYYNVSGAKTLQIDLTNIITAY